MVSKQKRRGLAEIIGILGVIGSLSFVGLEVRQGSNNIHNSTSWAITQALAQLNTRLSSDQEFAGVWLRGLRDLESLDEVEAERFRAYAMDMLNLAVYVHSHPTPEHEFFVPYLAGLAAGGPGFRTMIELVEASMPEDLTRRLLSGG